MPNDVTIHVKWDDRDGTRFQTTAKTKATKAGQDAGDGFASGLDRGAKKGGKSVDDEMSRVASRTNAKFDAVKFSALSVGLPAAAVAGAAGVTAALGVAGAGFAALGVYAASTSEKVQTAAKGMANRVLDDVNGMGQAIEGDMVAALDDAGRAWDRLAPQVQVATAESGAAVRELSGSVTDLAENAMPGMLTAVKASEPVFKGVHSFSALAGDGIAQFFENSSRGSDAAGARMTQFGTIIQLTAGRLGTLFANLATGTGGPLNSLYVMVDRATGALVQMTAEGSGVIGFLQGFSTTGSGLITVLSGLVGIVSALPPGITQIGGAVGATSMLLSKFGVDAGAKWEGFGGKVRAVGTDIANARNPMNSLKSAGAGLVSGALNPASIATAGLSILLFELGRRQEEAAAKAQAHATNVQNLTSALREDGGVIGASVQQTTAKALADKNAAENARAFGSDIGALTAAATGHAGAMDNVVAKGNTLIDSWQRQGKLSQQEAEWNKINIKGLADKGGAAADVANMYGTLTEAEQAQLRAMENGIGAAGEQYKSLRETQDAARDLKAALSGVSTEQLKLNEASTIGQAAAANLSGAFADLAKAGGDVQAKGAAMVEVFDSLHGSQLRAEDAQQAWNDQMRDAGELLKGLNLPVHNRDFLNAAGAINTTSEAGSKLQNFVQEAATHMAAFAQSLHDQGKSAGEITQALAPMEGQLRNQLKAWGLNDKQVQAVLEHYGAIPSEIETVLKVSGGEASKVQVQTVLEELLKMPPEKGVKVSTLTEDAKKNLEDLGYQVVALPDGTFQVFANTAPGKNAADALINEVNHYQGTVTVHADTGSADGSVQVWQQRTDGTVGMTTTDTRVDPATGKIQTWLRQANGTWAWTNTDSRIDPATGKVQLWVQSTNGKWAWVNAGANTASAEGALNYAARTRTATINVGVNYRESIRVPGSNVRMFAKGGTVGYASGGEIQSVPRFADGGGMLDIRNGGIMRGPGTGTSDSILALSSRGPIAGSTGEMVIRASQTRKWRPLLEAINAGVNGFAGGGMVRYGEVSQSTWDSLYASGWRGNPNDGMEALYAPRAASSESFAVAGPRGSGSGRGGSSSGFRPAGSGALTLEVVTSGSPVEEFLAQIIRKYVRVRGGNVQNVFGRG